MQHRFGYRSLFAAILLALTATLPSAAQTPPPTVYLVSSQVRDAGGTNLLASGQLCAMTTDANDRPMGYRMGSAGGQTAAASSQASCFPVVNGGAPGFHIINSAASSPLNACIRLSTFDSTGAEIRREKCVQTGTAQAMLTWCYADGQGGITCSWDAYPGNPTPQPLVMFGPRGAPGQPGAPGCTVGSTCSPLANVALSGSAGDLSTGTLPVLRTPFGLRNSGFGGAASGLSADATAGGDSGISESFYGDFVCNQTAGTGPYSTPPGFDYANGHVCSQGFVSPAVNGQIASLARNLQFSGGDQPQATQFSVQGRIKFIPGSNAGASIGFNAAPAKTVPTDPTKHVLVTATAQGWVLDNQNVATLFLPNAGTSSGTAGTTDSGAGAGWNAPPAGTYDVTMTIPGDGSIQVSLVSLGTPQYSYSFRFTGQTLPACAAPCGSLGAAGGLQNLEVDALGTNDRVGSVAYSIGGPRATTYDLPHRSGYYNPAAMFRFPIAGNVWVLVPWGYQRNVPNKWVIVAHGYNETGQVVQNNYLPVTSLLLQQGYVIVSVDNTVQNCYGSPQCLADVTAAVTAAQTAVSLAPQPYFMADSMGGFQMLNAISHGTLHVRAAVGFCINTNLLWDYNSGGAIAPISAAYGISGSNPYGTATAGYDPQLATGTLMDGLASIPILLFASPSDTTVLKSQNADLFASTVNAAGGSVTVQAVTGPHESADHYRGPQVAAFFNQY